MRRSDYNLLVSGIFFGLIIGMVIGYAMGVFR